MYERTGTEHADLNLGAWVNVYGPARLDTETNPRD